MIIGFKDLRKLFAITIVVTCATFVCSLFLNYNIDINAIKDQITTPQGLIIYEAELASGKITAGVTGINLAATAVVLLVFYIKNYIDSHGKELGILKALGYSNLEIAKHFAIFAVSVLSGSLLGYGGAWIYMPEFYELRKKAGLLPEILPQLNLDLFILLVILLVILPALVFVILAIIYFYCFKKTSY